MNKHKLLSLFLIVFFYFNLPDLSAQGLDRRGQAIYVEFAGQGLFYSVNYETRFSRKTDGLGARVGASYLDGITTIPINLNFLLGKEDKNHFLELGLGLTFIWYDEAEQFGDKSIKQDIMGATTIMYRYHPRLGKFFFKVGVTPMYGYIDSESSEKQLFPWFGIAFGRAF